MQRILFRVIGPLLLLTSPLFGQLPDFYKSVDRLVWVVGDLNQAMNGWKKLGFTGIQELDVGESQAAEFRGKTVYANLRVASGRIGDVPVHWIQPLGGENAYSEFLEKHGTGVFSLVHRAPTLEAYESELKRLAGLRVRILQSGTVDSDAGTIRFAFLDTEPEGKYALGLLYDPNGPGDSPLAAPFGGSGRKVVQYAFVARSLEPVSRYWAKLGFPEMSYTHPVNRDRQYHGEPGQFDMRLGWQRHGNVVYEWIESLKGPNVYEDHIRKHGEGVHHLAFAVDDMDKETADWTAKGFPTGMSGAWGEKDKKGSGRFAYQDTDLIGGIDIELLWSYR